MKERHRGILLAASTILLICGVYLVLTPRESALYVGILLVNFGSIALGYVMGRADYEESKKEKGYN